MYKTAIIKKTCVLLLIVFFCSIFPISNSTNIAIAASEPTYYDYLKDLSKNDQAVAIGMFFSSIGLWTGDLESDTGIEKFSTYLIYDMDSVINNGKSIWFKLSNSGMTKEILEKFVKENLVFRPSIREFFSIANTLDETAIRALDKGDNMLLYPTNQKFVGRNVALAFVLFNYFNMPVLLYKDNFTIYEKNVEFLEDAKSLFTIESAGNVSYIDSAKNLAKELNKLSVSQINKYLPILKSFNILSTSIIVSPNPTASPTTGPAQTPLPTPQFNVIVQKIINVTKKTSVSSGDVTFVLNQSNLFILEVNKWYSKSDRYATDSFNYSSSVFYAYNRILKKVNVANDRLLISKINLILEHLRPLPNSILYVGSLIPKFDGVVGSVNSCLIQFKTINSSDKNSKIGAINRLGGIAKLLTKFSSKVLVNVKKYSKSNNISLDKSKASQLASAVIVSKQTAQHFKKLFSKYKLNVSKAFNPNITWCVISCDGITNNKTLAFYASKENAISLRKVNYSRLIVNCKYYQIEYISANISSKTGASFTVNSSNTKGELKFVYSSKNISNKGLTVETKYLTFGDKKKPARVKFLHLGKVFLPKKSFDNTFQTLNFTI
ncbi:MAG: hypothetical protein WCQ41_00150 [Bacillota bacterium]